MERAGRKWKRNTWDEREENATESVGGKNYITNTLCQAVGTTSNRRKKSPNLSKNNSVSCQKQEILS